MTSSIPSNNSLSSAVPSSVGGAPATGVVNLSKGGLVNLSKIDPGLNRVRVGLGWKANATDSGSAFDLDVSAFVLKLNDKRDPVVVSQGHFIFYNNKVSPEGAVTHMGDNQDGQADGDDETIIIDLNKLPAETAEVSFIVTIHDSVVRKQNFGQIRDSYIAMYNDETGVQIARYDLREDFSSETAVQFGSLERNSSGKFSFAAVGAGYGLGLASFVTKYGLQAG